MGPQVTPRNLKALQTAALADAYHTILPVSLLRSTPPSAARYAASGTASAISSRRSGVRRAFLWMFIRVPPTNLKRGNSSLLGRARMDNLSKAHI